MIQKDVHEDIIVGHSTTEDGNMDFRFGENTKVEESRKNFFAELGVGNKTLIEMKFEHAADICTVKNPGDIISGSDALITNNPEIALFLVTADCLPVIFYDPDNKVVALLHLGWRSTDKRLAPKVIRLLQEEFNTEPRNLIAYIGPGIHKESYKVKDEDLQQKNSPFWHPYIKEFIGSSSVDIVGYNIHQLETSGVRGSNITVDEHDTAVSKDYFSHYRASHTEGEEGRFITVVALQ